MSFPGGWSKGESNHNQERNGDQTNSIGSCDLDRSRANRDDLLKKGSKSRGFNWARFSSIEEGEKWGESEMSGLLHCLGLGESAAFWILWQGHQKYLYSVCLRQMGGKHEDAEDALSISMLKALDKFPAYARKITNPRGWLTRLTYNVCIDIHRERRRRTKSNENIEDLLRCEGVPPYWVHRSPEEGILHSELYAQLCRAVADLPAQLREPFVLRFFQETSYPEIADCLSLSIENVRKRIQKARAIIREKLEAYHTSKRDASAISNVRGEFVFGGAGQFVCDSTTKFTAIRIA